MFVKDPKFIAHHGFFGRQGGVSGGIYGSLNCGFASQDDQENVRENRARVTEEMGTGPENLATVYQLHSDVCVYATQSQETQPRADALVADVPGLAIGVLTADCAPVLLQGVKADDGLVIGAAHAGWGGAVKGILESTVKMMQECGAEIETITASIGPCIGPASYEVSQGFEAPFLNQDTENEHFFKSAQKEGHLMFDLPGYCARRLVLSGVGSVSITGIDTYGEEDAYFSYRRSVHRQEADYGRQISTIMINP